MKNQIARIGRPSIAPVETGAGAAITTERPGIKDLPPLKKEEKELYRARFKQDLFRQIRAIFRRLQDEQKVTQRDLARRLSTDEALVSKRLRGEANLTVDTLCDLARAMDARLEAVVRPLSEVRQNVRFVVSDHIFVFPTRSPSVAYLSGPAADAWASWAALGTPAARNHLNMRPVDKTDGTLCVWEL